MNYQEFTVVIERKVCEIVKGEVTVTIQKILKNNDCERVGISFSENGEQISPMIYLEEYYMHCQRGQPIHQIAQDICGLFDKVKIRNCFLDETMFAYENVKKKLVYRLIHAAWNQKLLEEVPYIPYYDMAIVFYLPVEFEGRVSATALIRNTHCKSWNVDAKELYVWAHRNTATLFPARLQTMLSVIKEMMDLEDGSEEDFMYVLTNEKRNFGAACILYPDMLNQIYTYLGENYFVIPSSIHEVILIPESKSPGKEELRDMIGEINDTQVEAEERLNDHAYYYNHETGELSL